MTKARLCGRASSPQNTLFPRDMMTTQTENGNARCSRCQAYLILAERHTCQWCIDELRAVGAWCDVHGQLWQEPVWRERNGFSVCVGTKGPEECPACAELDRGYQRLYRDVQMERLRDSLAAAYEDHYGPGGGAA